tara:strand:- start:686 stop:874 length:189 start_codon:yes stop_codon:yes gene_type:complete
MSDVEIKRQYPLYHPLQGEFLDTCTDCTNSQYTNVPGSENEEFLIMGKNKINDSEDEDGYWE